MELRLLKNALLVCAVIAVIAFLAHRPASRQAMPGRKPVYFWHMWSGEWQPVVEGICNRFNESQSTYQVIPLYVPPDEAQTKFLLTAAGGSPPDLVSQWNPVLGTWTDKHLIRPVEDFMTPAEKKRYLSEAFPIFRNYSIYRGKIMCMVTGIDCYAAFYRLEDLKEVGRGANSLPKTFDDLVALGKQLDKRGPDGSLKRVGLLPQGILTWAPLFGGRFQTEGKMLVDTPQNRAALQFIVDQTKRLGKDNVERFIAAQPADTGLSAPLLTGNYSILVDGQWKVKQTADVSPGFPYVVAPIPSAVPGLKLASRTNANYMVIPRAAKNPEGAMAFVKYWTGFDDAEAGGRNVADMGWLPYCKRVARSETYRAYVAKYPQFSSFVDLVQSPNLIAAPVGPIQTYVMDQIDYEDQAATRLSISPADALAELQRNIEAESERQRKLGNVK
jgi:multiple sugar transport system substrate-binding protein